MILDGWGKSPDPKVSAIDNANTQFIDSLYSKYDHATLRTDGLHVGLPEGQMGNSEVGHMNLGAGRIVYQDLAKINLAITNDTLREEKVLKEALSYAKTNQKAVHLLGLVSDGGVHSHINHLYGLLDVIEEQGVDTAFIHAFTDGRDVDPKSGYGFISELESRLESSSAKLATITGRYYAMDRDNRWERVKLAYDALVKNEGVMSANATETIESNYKEGVTDEFLKPIIMVDKEQSPVAKIKEGDVVLFFNFRTDRGRELTEVLSQNDNHEFNMHKLNLHYVTMTNYDDNFKNIQVIFNKDNLSNTLGEVLESHGKTQLRIAETEKYPHVTFFFNDYRDDPFSEEDRGMAASPRDVSTYDQKPEMSAEEVTAKVLAEIDSEQAALIIVNFANGDMVGHTGVVDAAVKAVEKVDACVGQIVEATLAKGGSLVVTADHGNCEQMIDPKSGGPHTAHTTFDVPLIVVEPNLNGQKLRSGGRLADIAPTILELLGLPIPEQMTGEPLLKL